MTVPGTATRLEIEALRRRLADHSANLDQAVTLSDIAEATGLTEDDVRDHLRQIRAEAAFWEPVAPRPSALPWIAAGALAVGVGITWWRFHSDDAFAPVPRPSLFPASQGVTTVVRSVQTTSPPIQWTSDGTVPVGFRVEVAGQTSERVSEGQSGEKRAIPYRAIWDGLVGSVEALITATVAQEGSALARPDVHLRDMNGETFSPRKGFVRARVSGWAGSDSVWVAVPLADVGRAQIRKLVDGVLGPAKAEQDAALAKSIDPTSGLVGPPPGFSIRFAGRRLDFQEGPRVSFAPILRSLVVRRLEDALLNAVARDRRAPFGAWTGNAALDAKIPQPAISRAEILGPEGLLSADIPTDPRDRAATVSSVRAFAERAAAGIENINRKALQKDETARP